MHKSNPVAIFLLFVFVPQEWVTVEACSEGVLRWVKSHWSSCPVFLAGGCLGAGGTLDLLLATCCEVLPAQRGESWVS